MDHALSAETAIQGRTPPEGQDKPQPYSQGARKEGQSPSELSQEARPWSIDYPTPPRPPSVFSSSLGAVGLHALFLLFFVVFGAEQAIYRMAQGDGAVAVELIAAQEEALSTHSLEQPFSPPEAVQAVEPSPHQSEFVIPHEERKPPKVIKPKPRLERQERQVQTKPQEKPLPSEASPSSELAGAAPATTGQSGIQKVTDLQAAYLRNPPPKYPSDSKRAGEQGVVLLSVVLSHEGVVDEVSVSASSGFERLDSAALNAVKRWVFKPSTVAGIPVRDTVKVPIRFVLKN